MVGVQEKLKEDRSHFRAPTVFNTCTQGFYICGVDALHDDKYLHQLGAVQGNWEGRGGGGWGVRSRSSWFGKAISAGKHTVWLPFLGHSAPSEVSRKRPQLFAPAFWATPLQKRVTKAPESSLADPSASRPELGRKFLGSECPAVGLTSQPEI